MASGGARVEWAREVRSSRRTTDCLIAREGGRTGRPADRVPQTAFVSTIICVRATPTSPREPDPLDRRFLQGSSAKAGAPGPWDGRGGVEGRGGGSREEECSPGSDVRGYQNSNPEADLGPPLGFPSPWPSVPPCLRGEGAARRAQITQPPSGRRSPDARFLRMNQAFRGTGWRGAPLPSP